MPTQLLLPNKFKKAGIFILIPTLIVALYINLGSWLPAETGSKLYNAFFTRIIRYEYTDEIIGVLLIIGLWLTGFSKEKQEDESIASLRLSSLLWAILLNYAVLLLAIIFTYDISFLKIMMYNLVTPLLVFIIRFNLLHWRDNKKSLIYEKQYQGTKGN